MRTALGRSALLRVLLCGLLLLLLTAGTRAEEEELEGAGFAEVLENPALSRELWKRAALISAVSPLRSPFFGRQYGSTHEDSESLSLKNGDHWSKYKGKRKHREGGDPGLPHIRMHTESEREHEHLVPDLKKGRKRFYGTGGVKEWRELYDTHKGKFLPYVYSPGLGGGATLVHHLPFAASAAFVHQPNPYITSSSVGPFMSPVAPPPTHFVPGVPVVHHHVVPAPVPVMAPVPSYTVIHHTPVIHPLVHSTVPVYPTTDDPSFPNAPWMHPGDYDLLVPSSPHKVLSKVPSGKGGPKPRELTVRHTFPVFPLQHMSMHPGFPTSFSPAAMVGWGGPYPYGTMAPWQPPMAQEVMEQEQEQEELMLLEQDEDQDVFEEDEDQDEDVVEEEEEEDEDEDEDEDVEDEEEEVQW